MDEDTDHLQEAIDRVVASIHVGIEPAKDDIETIRNDWEDDIFGRTDYITNGISLDSLQSRFNDQNLSESEGVELDEITDESRIDFARERIVVESSDFDSDFSPAFRGGIIKSTNGFDAWIVFSVTGYSFSGIDISFEGVFTSEDAFRNSVRKGGALLTDEVDTIEGTKKLVSDKDILALWER